MKRFRLRPIPGHPIGYLSSGEPVYPFLGAAKDDEIDVEPDEEEEDPDEPDDVEDEDDEPDDKLPTKAEWLKVRAALARSNASAKQRREALAAAEKELAELREAAAKREADDERKDLLKNAKPGGKKAAAGTPTPVLPDGVLTKTQVRQELARVRKEAAEEVEAKYRDVAVKSAARAALSDAGVKGSGAARMVSMLNLKLIELDEDGEVAGGLDEQIEELKEEFPQLFKEPEPVRKRRAPAPRANGAGRKADEEEDTRRLSTAERMAREIAGSRQ